MKTTKWKICQCIEFKCQDGTFEDEDGNHQEGVAFSLSAFKRHQDAIKKRQRTQEATPSVLQLPEGSQVSGEDRWIDENIVLLLNNWSLY